MAAFQDFDAEGAVRFELSGRLDSASVEQIEKPLIEQVLVRAEERVVQHDGVEQELLEPARKAELGVDIPDVKLRVSPEGVDVLRDGRRVFG